MRGKLVAEMAAATVPAAKAVRVGALTDSAAHRLPAPPWPGRLEGGRSRCFASASRLSLRRGRVWRASEFTCASAGQVAVAGLQVCVCVFITRACKLKKSPRVARNSLCQSCSLESPYGPNLWSSLSCVTCVRCHRVCSGPSPFPFPFPCSCVRTCVRVAVAPATAAVLAARAAAAVGSRRGRGSRSRARSG